MPQERWKSEGYEPLIDREDKNNHIKGQIAPRYEIKAAVWSPHGWRERQKNWIAFITEEDAGKSDW